MIPENKGKPPPSPPWAVHSFHNNSSPRYPRFSSGCRALGKSDLGPSRRDFSRSSCEFPVPGGSGNAGCQRQDLRRARGFRPRRHLQGPGKPGQGPSPCQGPGEPRGRWEFPLFLSKNPGDSLLSHPGTGEASALFPSWEFRRDLGLIEFSEGWEIPGWFSWNAGAGRDGRRSWSCC